MPPAKVNSYSQAAAGVGGLANDRVHPSFNVDQTCRWWQLALELQGLSPRCGLVNTVKPVLTLVKPAISMRRPSPGGTGTMMQGRDGSGACPCCGTGVLFRRDALVSIGGQVRLWFGTEDEDGWRAGNMTVWGVKEGQTFFWGGGSGKPLFWDLIWQGKVSGTYMHHVTAHGTQQASQSVSQSATLKAWLGPELPDIRNPSRPPTHAATHPPILTPTHLAWEDVSHAPTYPPCLFYTLPNPSHPLAHPPTPTLKAYGSITEDFNTAMALLSCGFSTMYLDERLVFGLAPDDMVDLFAQVGVWARLRLCHNQLRLRPWP